MKKMVNYITKLFISISCLLAFIEAGYILPTIFWDPRAPALHRDHWSKVINVKLFQSVSFLCPNTAISFIPLETTTIGIYYNLYVRELNPSDTNLDYDTVCDASKSHHVYSCNQTHNWKIDYRRLTVSKVQADRDDPTFNVGKDYIFFSTSNGQQNSLRTNSTKCTMVFRIRVCESWQTNCLVPLCPSFGREEVCVRKSTASDAPRDVHVTNKTSSSLNISWKAPLNTDNAVAYYSICYRRNTSQACQTKVVNGNSTSAILENLEPSTLCFIRVRAVTCKGSGSYSEEISHKTKDQPVTSPPKKVISSGVTSSSVRISWQSPDVIVDNVIFYSVCVREKKNGSLGQDCQITLVEPTQLSAVIYGLNSNTLYGIRVRAQNFERSGHYSEEIVISTLEIPTTEVPTSSPTSLPSKTTTTTTGETVAPPSAQFQHGCNTPTINSMSLIIGVVVGAIATLGILTLVWLWKVKRKQDVESTVQNVTNRGYRWSVSGQHAIDKKPKRSRQSTLELDSVAKNSHV